jgi:hypothetical protein
VQAILVLHYRFSSGFQGFGDYPKLDKVIAAFYEALRMFRELAFFFVLQLFISRLVASAHILLREAGEDTVLEIPKPHGQVGTTMIPVPKGAQVISYRIPLKMFLTMLVMSAGCR